MHKMTINFCRFHIFTLQSKYIIKKYWWRNAIFSGEDEDEERWNWHKYFLSFIRFDVWFEFFRSRQIIAGTVTSAEQDTIVFRRRRRRRRRANRWRRARSPSVNRRKRARGLANASLFDNRENRPRRELSHISIPLEDQLFLKKISLIDYLCMSPISIGKMSANLFPLYFFALALGLIN